MVEIIILSLGPIAGAFYFPPKNLLDFLPAKFYILASHPNPFPASRAVRGFCRFNQKNLMPEIGKVYQHNRVATRQMVPREFIEKDGRPCVRADSCTNQWQLVIPVADIHDGPATWGWSPVASGGTNNDGQ